MNESDYDEGYQSYQEPYNTYRPQRSRTLTQRITAIALISLSTAVIILMLVVSLIKPAPQPTLTPIQQPRPVKSTPVAINWTRVRSDISDSMADAEAKAAAYAQREIDEWMSEVRSSAEKSFLDELLGYMTQQRLALQSLYFKARHFIDISQPNAEVAMSREIEKIFCRHTLSAPVSQARLEEIAAESVALYVNELGKTLEVLPTTYDIGKAEWQRFIVDAASIVSAYGGTRSVPVVLKGLSIGSVASGIALAKPTAQLARTVAAKLMGRAATSTATTTAKGLGRMGGPVFLAIMVWDCADHIYTRNRLRPLLRSSLNNYFDSVESQLVDEVTGAIDRVQIKIIAALSRGKEMDD